MSKLLSFNRSLRGQSKPHKSAADRPAMQIQRTNLRRIDHIAALTLALQRLAGQAGLTITSRALAQVVQEARMVSSELREVQKS
jgi:hypothetical protein